MTAVADLPESEVMPNRRIGARVTCPRCEAVHFLATETPGGLADHRMLHHCPRCGYLESWEPLLTYVTQVAQPRVTLAEVRARAAMPCGWEVDPYQLEGGPRQTQDGGFRVASPPHWLADL